MRLIVKELVLLFLTIVQARYIGYQGYGGYENKNYYYQNLNHYGPSNPFGSSSAGLALNPHYAYSRAAYQDYKYQQVKYAPYRSAPEFDFGHDESKGKHYCPADRPFFIKRGRGKGKGRPAMNQCVERTHCGPTAYNPAEEACCPMLGQLFNFQTYECEFCPGAQESGVEFNPFTEQCCPENLPLVEFISEACGPAY